MGLVKVGGQRLVNATLESGLHCTLVPLLKLKQNKSYARLPVVKVIRLYLERDLTYIFL